MKKYLLPHSGQFYKANLHCHSTVSDGEFSPEELKKIYMEKGYSIIAFTDHEVLVPHPELCDETFLALNGCELEIREYGDMFSILDCCHLCFIALDPDNTSQVCYHSSKYIWGNALQYKDKLKYDKSSADFEREYTPECISKMMQIGRDSGFFVTYNHPSWSEEEKEQYCNYHGMHAMEIYNHSSFVLGYPEYNEKEYDQMLKNGEKIFCIATDDNHNHTPLDSRLCDSFGGFTMIKAEKLDYKEITNALLSGHFYCSQGPEIKELWIEDNEIHIKCSPADKIVMNTGIREAHVRYSEDAPLTEASFKINPLLRYVRITVTDKNGLHANTNAYFMQDYL